MLKIFKTINQSASWASAGVMETFKEEFMMRVQFSFGAIQFILSIILAAPKNESLFILWIWVTLVAMELMNTGVENVTDLASDKHTNHGRRAKDSAGGAVFILSVMSWVVTILLLADDFLILF